MAAQPLKVYWRPGCSSCVRVKEFLAGLGVGYESINVSATPQAMAELHTLGVRTVPVVVRGNDYVFAQELADVSRFIGREVAFNRLPPGALVTKWVTVLEAAQRMVAALPPERLAERATPGRDRSIRELAYHVFQIPDAFLRAVQEGEEDLASFYNAPPPPGVSSTGDIGRYGAEVTARLRQWCHQRTDRRWDDEVRTYYGAQPLHHLLERCTWHSAQHARQLIAVLASFGITPDKPLTDHDYAGLPMPAGLWE